MPNVRTVIPLIQPPHRSRELAVVRGRSRAIPVPCDYLHRDIERLL
jgi:hypothetical protein